jgi:hypothetical protein
MSLRPTVMTLELPSFAEQRVVRLLRLFADRQFTGAVLDTEIMRLGFTPATVRWFGSLGKLTTGLGYEFKPLPSPFVSAGELRLIGLLAQTQRVNLDHPVPASGELRDMLIGCAAALDTIGIRLPPLAMVYPQLPKPNADRATHGR